jgi:hypothetical protein
MESWNFPMTCCAVLIKAWGKSSINAWVCLPLAPRNISFETICYEKIIFGKFTMKIGNILKISEFFENCP